MDPERSEFVLHDDPCHNFCPCWDARIQTCWINDDDDYVTVDVGSLDELINDPKYIKTEYDVVLDSGEKVHLTGYEERNNMATENKWCQRCGTEVAVSHLTGKQLFYNIKVLSERHLCADCVLDLLSTGPTCEDVMKYIEKETS